MGEAGDEVHADVCEAGAAENFVGGVNVRAAMHATGGLQFSVDEGLGAEADAVEASSEPCRGFFRGDGFGIGFEGDFGGVVGVRKGRVRPERFEDLVERGGFKEARRAAAEVNRIDDRA